MHQNVHTCILEVNSTRIGIKLPVDIVYCVRSSFPHATRFMHRSNKEHTNMWKYGRTLDLAYISTVAVLPYETMICYPKLKSTNFHHCWETWESLRSPQLPSGLSAGPMFKWRGHRMRIGNRNKTSGWNTLSFLDLRVDY